MKFQSMVLLTVLCGLQAGVSFAAEQPVAGSAEKGQAKAAPCVACHGVNGNSVNPEWPNLAGQHESYIKRQLTAFKNDQRQNPLMTPMAKPLSDEDVADLGAFFASQKSTRHPGSRAVEGRAGPEAVPRRRSGQGPRGLPGLPRSGWFG